MEVSAAPSDTTDAADVAAAVAEPRDSRRLSLDQLTQSLWAAVESAGTKHDALLAMSAVAVNYSNATALLYFERADSGRLTPLDDQAQDEVQAALGTSPQRWIACCEQACREGHPKKFSVDETIPATVLVLPVQVMGGDAEALCAVFPQQHTPTHRTEILLQFVTIYMSLWRSGHTAKEMDAEANTLAAVLEVVVQIQSAPTLQHAAFSLTGQLHDYLDCQRTALGMRTGSATHCQLLALSNMSQFDHRSPFVRAIEAALDETLLRDKMTFWPAQSPADQSSAKAHEQLCSVAGCSSLVSTPLRDDKGEAVGVLILMSDKPIASRAQAIGFLRTADEPFGSSLALLADARRSPLIKAWKAIARQARSRWLRWAGAVALGRFVGGAGQAIRSSRRGCGGKP